jgi:hypothetical protein
MGQLAGSSDCAKVGLVIEIQEILMRFWTNLVERPEGPLAMRFVLQPIVAALLAVRDGMKDARSGRSPYFWTVLSSPVERKARLREGFAATGKVMIIAIVLDAIYQYLALKAFFPGEAIVVAFVLAFLPYLLLRGPVARVAGWCGRRRTS